MEKVQGNRGEALPRATYKLEQLRKLRKLFKHYPYQTSTERGVLRPHIVAYTFSPQFMCVPLARKVRWGFKTEEALELFKERYKNVIVS